MDIRLIEPGSLEHDAELDLRFRLLRDPLGMPRGSERYDHEADCLHIVALIDGRVVGCVLFHPTSAERGRVLQMAVDGPWQRQGLGRALVRHLEGELLARGVGEVVLHARDLAVGFYERLGYSTYGEPYIEVGIPHRSMRRRLDGVTELGVA